MILAVKTRAGGCYESLSNKVKHNITLTLGRTAQCNAAPPPPLDNILSHNY